MALGALAFRWTAGVTGCVVSVLYVLAWLRSGCSPLREEVRAHRMVWLFASSFVITFRPFMIYGGADHEVIACGLALNDVLNVLVFRCNSRF